MMFQPHYLAKSKTDVVILNSFQLKLKR